MDCIETKTIFWDYLEKKLEHERQNLFEAHLMDCAECRIAYKRFSGMITMIDVEKVTSPNPFFVEKTMHKIFTPHREPLNLEVILLTWLGVLRPAFVAMAIILSIGIGIFLGLPPETDKRDYALDSFAETYGLNLETGDILFD